jgi:hypothetical protein
MIVRLLIVGDRRAAERRDARAALTVDAFDGWQEVYRDQTQRRGKRGRKSGRQTIR